MKLGTRMVFLSLTALFVALAIGGCSSKNADAPKQEDQTQQELRKNKKGD